MRMTFWTLVTPTRERLRCDAGRRAWTSSDAGRTSDMAGFDNSGRGALHEWRCATSGSPLPCHAISQDRVYGGQRPTRPRAVDDLSYTITRRGRGVRVSSRLLGERVS